MMHWVQSALAVLLTFGVVIFLHEFGHFILCRLLRVRVERFAFGFGPELAGLTHNGTRFSLCAFPLGGFVKPAGDNLEDSTGQEDEYFSKSWGQRLLIVAAGPCMNYLLAFLLFFAVVWARGVPEPSQEPVLGELAAAFPAEQAGLRASDRIVKVAGTDVGAWPQMAALIHRYPNQPIEIEFLRDGSSPRKATLTPRLDASSGRGLIGIMPRMEYRPVGPLYAAKEGVRQCYAWTAFTIRTLSTKIYKRERPDVAGPVGIVQMVSRAAHSSVEDLVFLIGLISVAVGFFNLLPVPLLDGGHAALYIWEGLTRRKLTLRAMTVANSVGMAFLMSLLLFATYNDLTRIRESRRGRDAAREAPAGP